MARPTREVVNFGVSQAQRPSLEEDWKAILESLDEAGMLSFLRAIVEQRQPMTDKLIKKMDSAPTKNGVKTFIRMMMALGDFDPEGIDATAKALAQGFAVAQQAAAEPEADKMSVWSLMGQLKNPDVARGMHFVMGLLEGFGQALKKE